MQTVRYDAVRRPISKLHSMFNKEEFLSYDANGMLQQNRYRGYGGTYYFNDSGSLTFSRDASGLITGITGDKELSAIYDPDLQISSIAHTLPQAFAESYAYDASGNRVTSLSNSFIYDDLNKLTESTTHDYVYDADGNLTQERNKLTGETKKYYYDSENRMTKYEHLASDISPIDITATYKYDIFGRRIQKNVNGNVINFFWENDTMTYELNESHQPIRKYLVGLGIDSYEGHLEYSEVTDWPHLFDADYNQPWYSYVKDQVGTIYKVYSHKTRSVVDNRTYDSFGNLVNQTGTTKTPLGFQGKYYDAESGFNYFYHRYYNPAIGRFMTEDPIGLNDGINMYKLNNNNSINFMDPIGLSCLLGEKLTSILSVGLFNSVIALSQSEVAFDESQKQGFPQSSIHNGVMDAFRHCFWSCIMAQELGKETALKIGIIHEECSDNQPICEKNMDLKNNATGVKISEKGKTGRKSCRDGCNNAITKGDLIILEKN